MNTFSCSYTLGNRFGRSPSKQPRYNGYKIKRPGNIHKPTQSKFQWSGIYLIGIVSKAANFSICYIYIRE